MLKDTEYQFLISLFLWKSDKKNLNCLSEINSSWESISLNKCKNKQQNKKLMKILVFPSDWMPLMTHLLSNTKRTRIKAKKSKTNSKLSLCLSSKNSKLKAKLSWLNFSESVSPIQRKMILSKKLEEDSSKKPLPEQQLLRMITLVTFLLMIKEEIKRLMPLDKWMKKNLMKLHSNKLWNKSMKKYQKFNQNSKLKTQKKIMIGIPFTERKLMKLLIQTTITIWI